MGNVEAYECFLTSSWITMKTKQHKWWKNQVSSVLSPNRLGNQVFFICCCFWEKIFLMTCDFHIPYHSSWLLVVYGSSMSCELWTLQWKTNLLIIIMLKHNDKCTHWMVLTRESLQTFNALMCKIVPFHKLIYRIATGN